MLRRFGSKWIVNSSTELRTSRFKRLLPIYEWREGNRETELAVIKLTVPSYKVQMRHTYLPNKTGDLYSGHCTYQRPLTPFFHNGFENHSHKLSDGGGTMVKLIKGSTGRWRDGIIFCFSRSYLSISTAAKFVLIKLKVKFKHPHKEKRTENPELRQ